MDKAVHELFKTPDWATFVEIVTILVVAGVVIAGLQRTLPWIGNRLHGKRRLHLLALVPVIRLLTIVSTFLLIVPLLINPSLQNMVALLGTIGVALGFALKDYASSLIAGVVVVGERPYRNGDWVRIGDIYGEVQHVGMRTVRLVTPDDNVVTIPHARLWTDAIANANDGGPRLMVVAPFYLHPRHDAARVRQLLLDVALTSPYLHVDAPVDVIVQEKPWGTWYQLKAYPVDARQQFLFLSDLTVRAKAALSRAGVEFAAVPGVVTTPA